MFCWLPGASRQETRILRIASSASRGRSYHSTGFKAGKKSSREGFLNRDLGFRFFSWAEFRRNLRS